VLLTPVEIYTVSLQKATLYLPWKHVDISTFFGDFYRDFMVTPDLSLPCVCVCVCVRERERERERKERICAVPCRRPPKIHPLAYAHSLDLSRSFLVTRESPCRFIWCFFSFRSLYTCSLLTHVDLSYLRTHAVYIQHTYIHVHTHTHTHTHNLSLSLSPSLSPFHPRSLLYPLTHTHTHTHTHTTHTRTHAHTHTHTQTQTQTHIHMYTHT